jgi:hypothetical protein
MKSSTPVRAPALVRSCRPLALALTLALALGATASHAAPAATTSAAVPRADLGGVRASRETVALADAVVRSRDHQGAPFIVLDKRRAHVYVFDPAGRLLASAPALLGAARGDHSVPGIGDKPIADIAPEERTTPAGRFVAEMGHSSSRDEDVVWVDYDAAVSMHRVVTSNKKERRLQRLATPSPKDNRISYGCINLPRTFYERWVGPTVAKRRTIIYVLPETRPAHELFTFMEAPRSVAGGRGAAGPRPARMARTGRAGPGDGPMPLIDQ